MSFVVASCAFMDRLNSLSIAKTILTKYLGSENLKGAINMLSVCLLYAVVVACQRYSRGREGGESERGVLLCCRSSFSSANLLKSYRLLPTLELVIHLRIRRLLTAQMII